MRQGQILGQGQVQLQGQGQILGQCHLQGQGQILGQGQGRGQGLCVVVCAPGFDSTAGAAYWINSLIYTGS